MMSLGYWYDLALSSYLLLRTIHAISFICWMAGLLYLPRLFVYHTDIAPQENAYRIFCRMERRLFRYIMQPSMLMTIISGLSLSISTGWQHQYWLHGKVLLVGCLVLYHFWLYRFHLAFVANTNTRSGKFFRIINEFPTILLIGIVSLAIFKPC